MDWDDVKFYGETILGALLAIFVIIYNINAGWIWFL